MKNPIVKYLKKFNELNGSIDGLEDVEDMIVEITDQWPLLNQDNSDDLPWGFCRKNPEVKNISGQPLYYFRLKSKWVGSRVDDDPRYKSPRFNRELWPKTRGAWGTGISKDYYNATELDEEIKAINQMISHTRLNKSGYMIKSLEWKVYQVGTWPGGVYDGRPKEIPYIELVVMEPSWWKGEPIPYKEVSDLEAGII